MFTKKNLNNKYKMPYNAAKCNSMNKRNASCCNSPASSCCGKNGCLGPLAHGEVILPCAKRMALNAQRRKVNSMGNNSPEKPKEQKKLQSMMEGMRAIWEPICGPAAGGKSRKNRKNRSRKNKTARR